MKRLPFTVAAVLLLSLAAGCNKPTEESCRQALANMQHLMGTENLRDAAYLEGEVRRCKGGSKKKAVACAIKAQTLDELRKCDFYKVPANALGVGTPDTGSVGGSATTGSGAMGSGAMGSGAMGSAATGSGATGSGATGSGATGSAATGSGATGSGATGSGATGSGATGSGAAGSGAMTGSAAKGSAATGSASTH